MELIAPPNLPNLELRDDYDHILQLVSSSGDILQYASTRLRDDRSIVLPAVSNNGMALHYASDRLKNDYDIVKAAISQNGMALLSVSDELRCEFASLAVSSNSWALLCVPPCSRTREMCLMVLVRDPVITNFIGKYASDTAFMLEAISMQSNVLGYVQLAHLKTPYFMRQVCDMTHNWEPHEQKIINKYKHIFNLPLNSAVIDVIICLL